jgi:hypothetical protein
VEKAKVQIWWYALFISTICVCGCTHSEHAAKSAARRNTDPRVVMTPRKVYRFSVVPGGVYSAEELRGARSTDRVVAAHYTEFGDRACVSALPQTTYMYVSYRIADHVYWTSSKRRIPQGEQVLSDGAHLARARCGNRLSLQPQKPTNAPNEPTEAALSAPLPPSDAAFPSLSTPEISQPSFDVVSGGVTPVPMASSPLSRALPNLSNSALGSPRPAFGPAGATIFAPSLPGGVRSPTTTTNGGGTNGSRITGSNPTIGAVGTFTAIPEAGSLWLLLLGGAPLAVAGFRRARACRSLR